MTRARTRGPLLSSVVMVALATAATGLLAVVGFQALPDSSVPSTYGAHDAGNRHIDVTSSPAPTSHHKITPADAANPSRTAATTPTHHATSSATRTTTTATAPRPTTVRTTAPATTAPRTTSPAPSPSPTPTCHGNGQKCRKAAATSTAKPRHKSGITTYSVTYDAPTATTTKRSGHHGRGHAHR